MADLPLLEPSRIIAGTTLAFLRSLPDYPAPVWTLSYALVRVGARILFESTDNGDGRHLVHVDGATTGAWPAGTYQWQATVTNGVERLVVGVGTLNIVPDFAIQSTGYDGRSHARRCLDAIEAQIEGRATADQQSTRFGDRELKNFPISELIAIRSRYQAEVAREEAAASGRRRGEVMRVQF